MNRINSVTQRLGIEHPLIQGPFGGGLSTALLAATVSNLGGLGSFGAHHLAPEKMHDVVVAIRQRTPRPFAVNLWVSDHDAGGEHIDQTEFDRIYKILEPYFCELGIDKPQPPARFHNSFAEQIDALLAAQPPVFSFVFGVPARVILDECRRLDIVTMGAATSIAEAQALEHAGVDLIVASGSDAGGHRPSFLARAEDSLIGTFTLVQLLTRHVKTPVIAAGGIVDRAGVDAVMALGAQGAQIGTAFLACEESGASPAHRELLFSKNSQDTVLTRVFTGRLARGLRNRLVDELTPQLNALPPFPIQGWFLAQLKAVALKTGRTDLMSLWSGQIAPNLRYRKAAELMAVLAEART